MDSTDKFCTIIRDRSEEHSKAISLLITNGLYGQSMSILRQELDSLIRVVFLLSKDIHVREHFIEQTLTDAKWTLPNSRVSITDRNMVELTNNLHGWTRSVYKLGCAFIHLSAFADYQNSNPFQNLSEEEKNNIKEHLHNYHNFDRQLNLNIETLAPYLLEVFNKIKDNLKYYVEELERRNLVNTIYL